MKANAELTTPNQILAEGWRLTKAILALKGLKVPDIIDFQIDGADQIQATRVARLEELAKAIAALEQGIERLSEDEPTVTTRDKLWKRHSRKLAFPAGLDFPSKILPPPPDDF